ncbi:MAG: hypothetical protein HKP35_04685 [Silicimonas sp.]|nr:hypothetical protein [Silicimonas sp.]
MKKATAIALLLAPFTATADESGQLVPREHCTPLYTVQKRGCVAEHVLRCETPDRVLFRNEFVEDGALMDVTFSDADYEFVDEWNAEGLKFILGLVDNRDPFSLSNLRDTGVDVFDQTAMVDMQIVAPREATILGDARLTGETLALGGGVLEEVSVRATLNLSSMEIWMEGTSYVDRTTGTMFDGAYRMSIDGFDEELPGAPVEVLRDGDRGFMRNITLFDCGEPG